MKKYIFLLFIIVFFTSCAKQSMIKKTVKENDFTAFKIYVDKASIKQRNQMISDCDLFHKKGMFAREAVSLNYLKYLLDKGANPNTLSLKTNQRASICPANYLFKNIQAVELLLAYDMNPYLPPHEYVRSLFQHVDNQLNSMPDIRKLIYSYKEDFQEYNACKQVDKLICFKNILIINPYSKYENKIKNIILKKEEIQKNELENLVSFGDKKALKYFIQNNPSSLKYIKDIEQRVLFSGAKNLMIIDIINLLKNDYKEKEILEKIKKKLVPRYSFSRQEEIQMRALGFPKEFILKIKVLNNELIKKEKENLVKLRELRAQKNIYDENIDEEGKLIKNSDKVLRGVLKFLIENINPEKALIKGLN